MNHDNRFNVLNPIDGPFGKYTDFGADIPLSNTISVKYAEYGTELHKYIWNHENIATIPAHMVVRIHSLLISRKRSQDHIHAHYLLLPLRISFYKFGKTRRGQSMSTGGRLNMETWAVLDTKNGIVQIDIWHLMTSGSKLLSRFISQVVIGSVSIQSRIHIRHNSVRDAIFLLDWSSRTALRSHSLHCPDWNITWNQIRHSSFPDARNSIS